MLRRSPKSRVLSTILSAAMFLTISSPLLAVESHEDPNTATLVFSGVSLFRYYSGALDFVLQKDPAEVEARLAKMPFANIPENLKETTDNFSASSIGIAYQVAEIDEAVEEFQTLREQFRVEESAELAAQVLDNLSRARKTLRDIEQDTEISANFLKVPSAPTSSDLRLSYDEVLDRINRIRELLDRYEDLLKAPDTELLKETAITLEIRPRVAFVGDNITFEGVLTAEGKPLANREITMLANGSNYVTGKTDSDGHFQGILPVPYWYTPEIDFQALYYPRGEDVGLYRASLSPVVKLAVLFYETRLEIEAEDRAYPGLETFVAGQFDYGDSPMLSEREVEIYLDDTLAAEVIVPPVFRQTIMIDAKAAVGKHVVTVSAAGAGRYAPAVTSVSLDIIKAIPMLDITMPTIILIPGSFEIGGKLYSEVGPLSDALIKMNADKSKVEAVSSEYGLFDTRMRVGMNFGVIGSQDVVISVFPLEPWHDTLSVTRTVIMVNVVNSGVVLGILIFFGIYLTGRWRRRVKAYPGRKTEKALEIAPMEEPSYTAAVITPATIKKETNRGREGRSIILQSYRLIVRLILRGTGVILGPQQTLREFADESSKILGPAAKYFRELTRLVERLLYSQYRPTEEDVTKSQNLSGMVETDMSQGQRPSGTVEELKGEAV